MSEETLSPAEVQPSMPTPGSSATRTTAQLRAMTPRERVRAVATTLLESELTNDTGRLLASFTGCCSRLYVGDYNWSSLLTQMRNHGLVIGRGSQMRVKLPQPTAGDAAASVEQEAPTAKAPSKPTKKPQAKKVSAKVADAPQGTTGNSTAMTSMDATLVEAFRVPAERHAQVLEIALETTARLVTVLGPEDAVLALRLSVQGAKGYLKTQKEHDTE